ncbi:MAG: class I SAM-dependent methyltransferase [Rhodanobacteraceae bacterium]
MAETGHVARDATRDAHLRRVVLEHCRHTDSTIDPSRFSAAIHPDDPMLLHSLAEHRDAGAALSQYFQIALQQHAAAMQILHGAFGADLASIDALDFACGHGRLLRFLSLSLPRGRIYASDLQADAVAFVRDTFGVNALASDPDPARFEPGRRFDFIWVASLFSHLPEPLFHAWLARLVALLTPRGVLAFSVRDAGLLPHGSAMPHSGVLYTAESENAHLATDIYGTTYASEAFVRGAVRDAAGDDRACVRLPRALANEQDLYVVGGSRERELGALAGFRRGPWGWVDIRKIDRGELHLEGWAASLDDGAVDQIEIEIDGESAICHLSIARPDVAAAFGDARLANAGWSMRHGLDANARAARVAVSARTARGEAALLFAGDVLA